MYTKKSYFPRIINSLFKRGGALSALASVLVLFPMIVYGAAVDLAWDANTEPDLTGYKIHYGTASGNYSDSIDVGDVTEYTLAGLEDGVTYYLAATAYDEDNNESAYSVELVHTSSNGQPNNTFEAEDMPIKTTGVSISGGWNIWGNGYIADNMDFATGGTVRFDVMARGSYAGGDWPIMEVRIDQTPVGTVRVDSSSWTAYTIQASITPGTHEVAIAFINDYYNAPDDRNLYVDEVTITVAGGNLPPETSIIADGINGIAPLLVNFDGSGSHDPDGEIISYDWDFGDGTLDSGDTVSHTFSDPGVYTVTLIVTDNQGATGSDTIQITASSVSEVEVEITASAGANGSISPSGSVPVSHGSNRTYTISADANYHVQNVLVDGASVGAVSSYTFTNVTQNHTIQANFAIDTHTIAASAGEGGSISPAGSITLNHGSNQAFTMTPAENYHIDDVLVDGNSVGALATYQISNLSNNRAIRVVFADDKHPPTADAGADQAVYVNDRVHLDGSGSRDADGDSLIFHWSIVSKPSGSNATLSDTQAVKPDFDVDVTGRYTVQLIVNDGTVNSAPDTVTISTENSAPVSDAGADQSVRVNDRVQLDGSGSSDVDGNSLTFTWSFVSKPGGSSATLSSTQAVKPTFDVDVAGSYTVQLIVNDGTVNSTPDTVTISTENSAPVSDAGADQSVRVNDRVQLDGSGSSDVDGDSLILNWSIVSKPGGSSATLSSTQAVKPTFDVDVVGSYTVRLIVNDGMVNSAPNTVTISTENSVPVANAGADQAVRVNNTVQLDGSGCSDVDGDSLTFEWSLVSKPGGSSAVLFDTQAVKPAFDVDVAGNYTVQLIVNDGTVNSAPDTVTISTENSAPVGHAGAGQTVLVNETVQLDGSGSSDVDGDTLTFEWSLVSKPGGSNATLSDTQAVKPVFDVDVAGSYTVQLIVNDGTANSAPDTVTISTENSAPVGHAGAAQAVLVNDTVKLDGSASSDVDGDSLTFKWSFVSKPGESSATLSDTTVGKPTFVVDIAGTYTLQLIVNDGNVNSAPDTVTISTENSAPVSHAGPDQSVRVNDSALLDGSGSRDADGDTLTFNWSFISKPDGSIAALPGATTVNPTFMVDVAGSYIVQLIVNDGTDNSTPHTVTIITENAAPWSNAGDDQTVEEGETVTLSGLKSTDPDDNIAGYTWQQIGGKSVILSNSRGDETTFTAPNATTDADALSFRLTVTDTEGLQDIDYCTATVTRVAAVDSDGDSVPDDQDDFPNNADEYLDTDGDGEGNNADTDDDRDSMPDTWELTYGLDPLKDDAADDPDGDGVSNINEYNLGTEPNYSEGNFEPHPPSLITPNNHGTVGLTPVLETDEFYDPNINDVHSQTQWKIIRVHDKFCVFDVITNSSLTTLKVPKLILEEDTDYSWQVKHIDNQGTASEWSEPGYFTTGFLELDSDGDGVLDHQEAGTNIDLDKDGVSDREQSDIKCIAADSGKVQIGVSIRDAENILSILSLEIEEFDDVSLIPQSKGKPGFIEFGLLHFSLLLNAPGEETVVTIYLSRAAFDKGRMYKYDPVNAEWLDYSEYAEFSSNRREVHLTLKDGGFGDADGLENGIIVDPLAFGSESDPNTGSDPLVENVVENLDPTGTCFIASAGSQSLSFRGEISRRELSLVFILIMLAIIGKVISIRVKRYRRPGHGTSLMEGWRNSYLFFRQREWVIPSFLMR